MVEAIRIAVPDVSADNLRSGERGALRSVLVCPVTCPDAESTVIRSTRWPRVHCRDTHTHERPAIPFFATIVCKSAPIGRHEVDESSSIVSLSGRFSEFLLAGATVGVVQKSRETLMVGSIENVYTKLVR